MTTTSIQTATGADQDHLIAVIVLAFSTDPVARWSFPDPDQYLREFPKFVRAFGGRAFEHSTAHYVPGFFGGALWLPPDVNPDEEAVVALMQRTVSQPDQEAVFSLLEQMSGYHPTEPHWYLPLIGVDPAQQSKGYASELLKHALSRCDGDRKLAYLESTNPRNIPLYERHGFELLGTIQAGTSPPIFPMLRKPR